MKKIYFPSSARLAQFSIFLFILLFAPAAFAQDLRVRAGGDLHVLKVMPIGVPLAPRGVLAVDVNAVYSNVTNFGGSAATPGGSAVQGTGTVLFTKMICDDIKLVGTPPFTIGRIRFNLANLNATALSARPLIRFFLADGPGGAPGTLIDGGNFNPITIPAGSVSTFFSSAFFDVTSNNFWACVLFDNLAPSTVTTAAQLNNFGMGIFNPADVGTSADLFFLTTTAPATGSFTTDNPVGSNVGFGGSPIANLGWEFVSASTLGTIARANPNPTTSGSTVAWTVSFNKPISGLQAADFSLINSGLTGPAITTVTPVGAAPALQWTVTATLGTGVGTIGLNCVDETALNTTLTNTLPFVGEVYTVNASLPIELLSFTANAQAQTNFLKWVTASEVNSDNFEIQRSTDGNQFAAIGTVKSHGNSTKLREYTLVDKELLPLAFYRLKMNDVDGKSEYSKTVAVERKTILKGVKIYPNPVSDVLTIENAEGSTVDIMNAVGQTVLSQRNINQSAMNIQQLPSGIYFVKVSLEDKVLTQKIVKK